MKVLVLGSGARESAIAQKVAESKLLTQLFISPGNPGMEEYGETIDLKGDFQKIKDFVLTNSIEMVIVGPEQFLVDGIWDFFNN
ncbi:MAG: phosphoribosylamine--glycine ligase family protein, partial [Bacteroidales bacterium]|nr:phosphoribosylamine--glycine ligase family protein [Bacteroidales bacterium]